MTLTVSTSWDDGDVLDLRIADILNRYELKGTFYVARDFLDTRMSIQDIRDLAQLHEIGAHTLTHPVLTAISLADAKREIEDSKKWLEDVLGQAVDSFCYPKGAHNAQLAGLVKAAGYRMARNVQAYHTSVGDNLFSVPTTLQIYPLPLRPLPDVAIWRGWTTRLQPLRQAIAHQPTFAPWRVLNWRDYALSWASYAAEHDGIWHLWGHSWEVEQYQQWQILDETLKHLSERFDCVPKTNSELVI
ncbi:MAG: polysaccharide deacetylase family protein [Phototrophicaceae bacterium]